MNELLVVVTALAVSILVIPAMMRLAPRLGMIDVPDVRKVHARPVPRVGGFGIALGALAALFVIGPEGAWIRFYVAGALVLLVFGALDDSREMGHYTKFAGQFLAVIPIVWFGDVWVSSFPFLSAPLPEAIGKPFTALAIVGVINAINHSDGLDGLAAGVSALSLGCCAYLANLTGDVTLVVLCLAVLGGLFGFLRFNTHPASVFMGDAGSQFLGFSLGTFAVVLTQQSNSSVSMALPLLMLGVPVIDILAVFYLRVSGRMNWFRATRNHVHHRLLDLGFEQYRAVVLIYAMQTYFVICAIVFRHESDVLLLALYAIPCALLFAALSAAERFGWHARRQGADSIAARTFGQAAPAAADRLVVAAVAGAVPAYFLAGALSVRSLPQGTGLALTALLAALVPAVLFPRRAWSAIPAKVAVYALAPLSVYAVERQLTSIAPGVLVATTLFYGLLAVAVALAWKFPRDQDFAPTTMDFLVAVFAVTASMFAGGFGGGASLAGLLVKVVILLYACELIFSRAGRRAREMLPLAALASVLFALVTGTATA